MGISSFAAGFLESAAERISTREKEAREVNRLKAEKQLKDFAEATKIKKAKRLEFKNNVEQIERALTSTKKSLSNTAIISIATDENRMKMFLDLAKTNPQKLDQYIKADEDPNLTLPQQIELAAERATPEVAPIMEQSAKYFGLPLGDTGAPIEAGAATAGVTEEQFKKGLAPSVPDAPEFKEDLAVAQQTTFNKTLDQAQLTVNTLINKQKEDPSSVDENEILQAKRELDTLNQIKAGKSGGDLNITQMSSLIDGAMKNITSFSRSGTLMGKSVTAIVDRSGVTIKPKQQLNDSDRRLLAKQFLEQLDPVIQSYGIINPEEDWYNKETLELNLDNLHRTARGALSKHANILMPSIVPATSVDARLNRKITIGNKTITPVGP